MIECTQESNDFVTPSSKHVYADNPTASDQASALKKLCIEPVDLEQSNDDFGEQMSTTKVEEYESKEGVIPNDLKTSIVVIDSQAVRHATVDRNGGVGANIVKKEGAIKKGAVKVKVEISSDLKC